MLHKSIVLGTVFCSLIVSAAVAQTTEPTAAEKALADKLNCADFKHNPDGSWTSGPNARIGTSVFSDNTFEVHGINLNGADVAVVLNQKCGG